MEKFNLEKINKKPIPTLPDNFFDEMQAHVFKRIREDEPKLEVDASNSKLNPIKLSSFWKYAIAASVVVLISLSIYFLPTSDTPKTMAQQNHTQLTKSTLAQYTSKTSPMPSSQKAFTDDEKPLVNKESYHREENSPVFSNVSIQSEKEFSNKNSTETHKATNFDEKMEVLLSTYSQNELKSITSKAEQDVYLDLYY